MSAEQTQDIVVSRDQGVLALGLNRPGKLNAITRDMYAILAREINAADHD
jgi:enoyl-CoA hydratase/carnithine racemase